ncbi:TPA: NinE family protein [Escherichia coli]|nr:NinE family protein [Escherichia coli]HCO7299470.1 NinE family protein [Escherichia coli]HCO8550228.1 NinE family protein [Escherichia coli]
MTNTAKILNFGRGNFAEQERRVADIDDGYTRFANELLEAIASADLTARQLKVMLAYVRKTYGFNKKTDRIADEQIAQLHDSMGYWSGCQIYRQEVRMRRQRRSFTDIICENCKYLPTKRSRNKRKPIPKESDVKTFNYTAHLWDIRWLRHRARKTR